MSGFLSNVDPKPPPRQTKRATIDYRGDTNAQRYAGAAFSKQVEKLNEATEGKRNDALNIAAFELRPFINMGLLSESDVEAALTETARYIGLDESEIGPSIRSGFDGADVKNASVEIPELKNNVGVLPAFPHPESRAAFELSTDTDVWGDFPPVQGMDWLFNDADDTPIAIWGEGQDILWAHGEALMIAGVMGLGKTTLAGRILRGQLGLEKDVLGLPVAVTDKPILYLAMDRPRQIRRSMRRQFSRDEYDQVADRLIFRQGPPVADIATNPILLTRMAQEVGAGTVYLDSLKDAVVGLTTDEVAASYNRARQNLLARDINLLELHHMVKRNAAGGPPSEIADVYGSAWLTAGAGSVITLSGQPGDLIIKFKLAKMPADEVGPWKLLYNPDQGEFEVVQVDFIEEVGAAGANGVTAKDIAILMYDVFRPTDSECKKAARQLDKLVNTGVLVRQDGSRGGPGGSKPTTWYVDNKFSPPKIDEGFFYNG